MAIGALIDDENFTIEEVEIKTEETPVTGNIICGTADKWKVGAAGNIGVAAMYYETSDYDKETAVMKGKVVLEGSGSAVAGGMCKFADGGKVSCVYEDELGAFGKIVTVNGTEWDVIL